jgi:hypothetical protein
MSPQLGAMAFLPPYISPIHVDRILRFFRAYEAAMASKTIRAAWRQTGFEYEDRNITTYLSINEGQIRESRDFREI